MPKDFLLGCHGRGAQHIPGQPMSVDEKFRLVKASGVFDFFDRQNAAMARWIRATWAELKAQKAAARS